jgi:lipoprotein-anchoring transpeptidase ErfK/SrfK
MEINREKIKKPDEITISTRFAPTNCSDGRGFSVLLFGGNKVRRLRISICGLGVLIAGLAAPVAAQSVSDHAACGQIRAVCRGAGFMPGAGREGTGLIADCVNPIVQGVPQRPRARLPLPQIDPRLVADCRASGQAFGRPAARGSQALAPALPGSAPFFGLGGPPFVDPGPGGPPAPLASRDGVARPPAAAESDQRSVVASLPPEVQPEAGPAKALPPQLRRATIDYRTKEPAGTIIIDTPHTYLYLTLGNGKAIRYGIGVGREGFTWSGTEKVSRMAEWPDWNPPSEMIDRQPYLPRFMAGGEGNPLGARALYLGQTLYRIHGTNQPSTIGTFVSSGCIRLTNDDITDLYGRVQVGTRVVVLPGTPPKTAEASTNAPPTGAPPVRRP